QAKVFDPFFTTKSAGRGLGLAVVQGIVRSLSGAIQLTSEPDRATTFQVLLPCAGAMAVANGHAMSLEGGGAAGPHGTVLIVEDEAACANRSRRCSVRGALRDSKPPMVVPRSIFFVRTAPVWMRFSWT